jgi:hypothetical protein
VLVLILCVAHASIRREGAPVATLNSMTTADLITALRLAREVEAEQDAPRRRAAAETPARADEPAAREPDEGFKPLALATARAAAKKD